MTACYRVTVTATVAVCFNAPLVPVIVTVYVPLLIDEGTLTVKIEVPELTIDVGLTVAVNPPDTLADNETVPLNPFKAETVILEVPCCPLRTLMLLGDAEIVKSGLVTVIVTVTLCVREPLVPVTVTV